MARALVALVKDPGLNFQRPQDGSQPPVTLVPHDPIPASGLLGLLHAHSAHKLMQVNTHTHK